ncbi:MAG TPA: tetratricopeptide repeat protein [Vicinamibacterales bacterium]
MIRPGRIAAAVFGLVLLVSPAGVTAAFAQVAPQPTRMLVMPFEATDRDPRAVWLGEASAVLIADTLREMGLPALTRQERLRAFAEVNIPAGTSLSYASLIRVGQLVTASDLVVGTLRLSGDDLVIEARRIRLDTGRVQEQVTDRAPLRDLFTLHERVAHSLMRSTRTPPPQKWPRLEAFEMYIKGLIAEKPETQVKFLRAALAAQPGYDRAQLGLWEAYTEQGDHARALVAAQAVSPQSRFARRARFAAGRSLVALDRLDEAFTTFKTLLDEQPTATLYNNLGVIQVRRGGNLPSGRATYFFTKATEFDPEEPDFFFNLGYAYFLDKDYPAAIYWLREAVRRNTGDDDAHFVLGAALQATGAASEAASERELARQLSAKYEEWTRKPQGADTVPRGLERLSPDLETLHGARLDTARLSSAQREQRELATFHLDRGRRLFQAEQNREALIELRKAIYLDPYAAEPHELIGRLYLRTGRPREAIDALRVALWSQESAEVRVALAEALLQAGEAEAARTEATRALELNPSLTEAKELLARIDKR